MFDRWITLGLDFLPSVLAALAILLVGSGRVQGLLSLTCEGTPG